MGKFKNIDRKKPVADTISIEKIYSLSNEIKSPEYKMIYYIIYLTGARVSEALRMFVRDIEFKELNDGKKIAVFDLITVKRKDHPRRKIPVLYYDPTNEHQYLYERKMINYIKNYIEPKLDDEWIFKNRKYNRVTNYFRRHLQVHIRSIYKGNEMMIDYKIHPHYLRHCRITHMRTEYNFDVLDLKQFAGWTDISMTNIYLHAGYKNLVEKMIHE